MTDPDGPRPTPTPTLCESCDAGGVETELRLRFDRQSLHRWTQRECAYCACIIGRSPEQTMAAMFNELEKRLLSGQASRTKIDDAISLVANSQPSPEMGDHPDRSMYRRGWHDAVKAFVEEIEDTTTSEERDPS